jgi:hypothetical protein
MWQNSSTWEQSNKSELDSWRDSEQIKSGEGVSGGAL